MYFGSFGEENFSYNFLNVTYDLTHVNGGSNEDIKYKKLI